MFYIRRKKQTFKKINESMYVPDVEGITKLTNYITDYLFQKLAEEAQNSSTIYPWIMPTISEQNNPCKDWLDINSFSVFFNTVDNKNFGAHFNPMFSYIDDKGKIKNADITIEIPENILIDDSIADDFIKRIPGIIQHEITHGISEWREFEIDKKANNSKKSNKNSSYDPFPQFRNITPKKSSYTRAYNLAVKNMNNDVDISSLTPEQQFDYQVKKDFGQIFYRMSKEERVSYIADYYQTLLRAKKQADASNKPMPDITTFEEYEKIISIEEYIDDIFELMLNDKEYADALVDAFPSIIFIGCTLFNVKRASIKDILKKLKEITKKEKRKYQKIYATVKLYGRIPPKENLI